MKIMAAAAAGIAVLALAIPAFAQTGMGVPAAAGGQGRFGGNASTTMRGGGGWNQISAEGRVQNMQERGSRETQNRINALDRLLARIGAMKNLTGDQKASFSAEIQSEISDMASLEAEIQSGSSTTGLRNDLKTLAPDYRIYALIMPQLSILSAVDRANTVASYLKIIQGKIQARVSADSGLSGNAAIASDLSDMAGKLADAASQAGAAQTEVSGLKPDNGDKAVFQSNTTALKDARSKLRAVQQDLAAARKDAGSMVRIIVQSDQAVMRSPAGAPVGATASSSQGQ